MEKILKCNFSGTLEVDQSKFKDINCLLTISIGQEYHEGDKFSATIDLINRSFKSCTIMLYDTLQRYTMALVGTKSPDDYYDLSMLEGDFWLNRNKKYYERLNNLKSIIRWGTWLNHKDFYNKKIAIEDELAVNHDFLKSFTNTAEDYLTRYKKRLKDESLFHYDRASKICMDYLIEECSALCLWPELDCDIDVYPSKRNPAMDATHRLFVVKNHPGRLYSVGLKFKGRKQVKPQVFNQSNFHDHSIV